MSRRANADRFRRNPETVAFSSSVLKSAELARRSSLGDLKRAKICELTRILVDGVEW